MPRPLLALLSLLACPIAAAADPLPDAGSPGIGAPAPGAECAMTTLDAAGNLVCWLGPVFPVAPDCPALDLKQMGKRLARTEAVSFFTKLTMKLQFDALIESARAYRTLPASGNAALELRRSFELLHASAVSKLESGGDRALAAEVGCNRERLWSALLVSAAP